MRERTPSADDTPKRAPPAPPREADVASKATRGPIELYHSLGISSTARCKMVASTNNLEDLGVSHPASASTEIRQQQQQQGHACRSVPTAQDKRSRLSNVINNLRKKVPETKCESSSNTKEDDRNTVERSLETLEKYVMTVLNGVIKDEEDKERESRLDKFTDADKLNDSKEPDEDCVKKGDDSKDCENRLEPFVPASDEANVFTKGTSENHESREGKDSLQKFSSKHEDSSAVEEKSEKKDEEEVETRRRTLGAIIMERLSEHQDSVPDSFHQLDEESTKKSLQSPEEPSHIDLHQVCRELLDDLLNDVFQSIHQVAKVESSEQDKKQEPSENLPTSLHCSLPLEKVASVLQTCQTPETESPSSQIIKTPVKAPSPTVRHLCLYCERKFSSISLRQRHTERVHQLKGGRRSERNSRKPSHNCQYCSDKSVDNLDGLFRHLISNHGDKYHACLQCVTRYLSKEVLTNHMNEVHNVDRTSSTQESVKETPLAKELVTSSRDKMEVTPKEKKIEEESDYRESAVNNPINKELLSNPGSPEFDSSFYSSVSCNIRDNLLHHLDGKLQINSTSSNSSTVDVKSPTLYEPNPNQVQFPIDISLTAVTPVYNKDYSSDKLENSSEYAQKPRKNFKSHPRRVSFEKYNFPRKYDGKEQWSCSIKDLSKFDISTQLSLRKKQQLIKERDNLNRLNQIPILCNSKSEIVQTQLTELDPITSSSSRVNKSGKNTKADNSSETNLETCEINNTETECSSFNPSTSKGIDSSIEFAHYLRLRKWQEPGENNASGSNIHYAELTGEWSRPRIYICRACGTKYETLKEMEDHKIATHPNVWCSHYEFAGDQLELYKHLILPEKNQTTAKANAVSPEKMCTKCSKNCTTLAEFHKHMLECGGDQAWLLGLFGNGKKKCKWRPFGSRSRRRRNRGMKRNIQNSQTPRVYVAKEKQPSGPRVQPSDHESIQKMLANLPPKRASRKVLQESATRSQGRLRKIQTKARSNLVDNSSTRLSRKAVLRNKLLKNAKSFQRKRCRNDNISAAIETVVNNYADEKLDEKSHRNVIESSETNQAKGDTKSKIKSNNRSTKMIKNIKVLSKKKNIKSQKAIIQHPKTRGIKSKNTTEKTVDTKSDSPNETLVARRSSKDESNKINTDTTKGKSQSETETSSRSLKKKKAVDPVASLNASIKAKAQNRTIDGKFARGSAKISKSKQKSQSANGSQMKKRGKISVASGRFLRSKLQVAQNLMKDAVKTSRRNSRLSADKMVTTESAPVNEESKLLRASSRNSSINRKTEATKQTIQEQLLDSSINSKSSIPKEAPLKNVAPKTLKKKAKSKGLNKKAKTDSSPEIAAKKEKTSAMRKSPRTAEKNNTSLISEESDKITPQVDPANNENPKTELTEIPQSEIETTTEKQITEVKTTEKQVASEVKTTKDTEEKEDEVSATIELATEIETTKEAEESAVISKLPETSDLVNFSLDHIHQESCNSNMDSGKENSLEISLNVAKLKVTRQKKTRNSRKERTSKRSLNNVIGILTEGVNIPIEAQESVVLTLQTSLEVVNTDNIFPNNESARTENNLTNEKPPEVINTVDSSVQNNTTSVEAKEPESNEKGEEEAKVDETPVKDPPTTDIILDLSRRKTKGKGSFLERIVSKIAKKKDVSLESDAGFSLGNVNTDLENVPNTAPNLQENSSPNSENKQEDLQKSASTSESLPECEPQIENITNVSLNNSSKMDESKDETKSRKSKKRSLEVNSPKKNKRKIAIQVPEETEVEKELSFGDIMSLVHKSEVPAEDIPDESMIIAEDKTTESDKQTEGDDNESMNHLEEIPKNTESQKKSKRKLNSVNQNQVISNTSDPKILESQKTTRKSLRKSQKEDDDLNETLEPEKEGTEKMAKNGARANLSADSSNDSNLKLDQSVYQFSEESDDSESVDALKISKKQSDKDVDSEMFKVPNTFTNKRSSKRKSLVSEKLNSGDDLSEDSSTSESTDIISEESPNKSTRRKYSKRKQVIDTPSESEDDISTDSSLSVSKENSTEENNSGKRQKLGRKAKQNISLVDEHILLLDDETLINEDEPLKEESFADKDPSLSEKKRPGRKPKNQNLPDSMNCVNETKTVDNSNVSEDQNIITEILPITPVEKKRPGRKPKKIVSPVIENIPTENISTENTSSENVIQVDNNEKESDEKISEEKPSEQMEASETRTVPERKRPGRKPKKNVPLDENPVIPNDETPMQIEITAEVESPKTEEKKRPGRRIRNISSSLNNSDTSKINEDVLVDPEVKSDSEAKDDSKMQDDLETRDDPEIETTSSTREESSENQCNSSEKKRPGRKSKKIVPEDETLSRPNEDAEREATEQLDVEKLSTIADGTKLEKKRPARKSRKDTSLSEDALSALHETSTTEFNKSQETPELENNDKSLNFDRVKSTEKKRPGRKSKSKIPADQVSLDDTSSSLSTSGNAEKTNEQPDNSEMDSNQSSDKKRPGRKAKKNISREAFIPKDESIINKDDISILKDDTLIPKDDTLIPKDDTLIPKHDSPVSNDDSSVLEQKIESNKIQNEINDSKEVHESDSTERKKLGRKAKKNISLLDEHLDLSDDHNNDDPQTEKEINPISTEDINIDKIKTTIPESVPLERKRPARKSKKIISLIDEHLDLPDDPPLQEDGPNAVNINLPENLNQDESNLETIALSERKRLGKKTKKTVTEKDRLDSEENNLISTTVDQVSAIEIENSKIVISVENEDKEKKRPGRKAKKTSLLDEHFDLSVDKESDNLQENKYENMNIASVQDETVERKRPGRKSKKYNSLCEEHLALPDDDIDLPEISKSDEIIPDIEPDNMTEEKVEATNQSNIPEINPPQSVERKRPARKAKKNISLIDEHLELPDDDPICKESINNSTTDSIRDDIANEVSTGTEEMLDGSKRSGSLNKKRSASLEKKQKTPKKKSINVSLFQEHESLDKTDNSKEENMTEKLDSKLEDISSTLDNISSISEKEVCPKSPPLNQVAQSDLPKENDKMSTESISETESLKESNCKEQETLDSASNQEPKESADDFQTLKKRPIGNFAVVHTKTGEILIVEKKKKLTKEAAKFFCDICATSFTRRSSLKKHNLSQSHLIQIQHSMSDKDQDKEIALLIEDKNPDNIEKPEKMDMIPNEFKNPAENLDVLNQFLDQHFKKASIPHKKPQIPVTIPFVEKPLPVQLEPENMEDDLLDEEICKITENMTHDEYVLTDHVSPVFPEAASTPIKNLASKIECNETKIVNKKTKKEKGKQKKRNLAEEHLDLDTPEPSLDTNVESQSSLEKDSINENSNLTLDNSTTEAPVSKTLSEIPIKSNTQSDEPEAETTKAVTPKRKHRKENDQNEEKFELEISSRNSSKRGSSKFGKIQEKREETSRPKRNQNKQNYKEYESYDFDQNDLEIEIATNKRETLKSRKNSRDLSKSKKSQEKDNLNKTNQLTNFSIDSLTQNFETEKRNTPKIINDVNIQNSLLSSNSDLHLNSKNDESKSIFDEDSSKLNFLNITETLKARNDQINCNTNNSINTEFDSDDNSLNTDMSVDIQKLLDDPELSMDNNSLQPDLQTAFNGDSILNKVIERDSLNSIETEQSLSLIKNIQDEIQNSTSHQIEPEDIECNENKDQTKVDAETEQVCKIDEENEFGDKNEFETENEVNNRIAEPQVEKDTVKSSSKSDKISAKGQKGKSKKKESAKNKKSNVNQSEFSDNEDALESQSKNKIVRSVFGRVFAGEKADKVKEVLDDWTSKSESSDNELNKSKEANSSRSRGDSKQRKDSKKNSKHRSRTSSASRSTSGKTSQKRKSDSQNEQESFINKKFNTSQNSPRQETQQEDSKLKTSRIESSLGATELLITSSRCRQSKKRAEERISTITKAFDDESSVPDDDLIITNKKGSKETFCEFKNQKDISENICFSESILNDKQEEISKNDQSWKVNFTDKSDHSKKSDEFDLRSELKFNDSTSQNIEQVSSIPLSPKSPSTVSQLTQNSDDEEQLEDDFLRRRMSPYFDCNNSYTTLGSSTNSEIESSDEEPKNPEIEDKNPLRRKSCSSEFSGEKIVIRSPLASHENRAEVVTIAPTDAIEDNALDVPQEIISATAAVSSMSQNKSRQGKVLNFDEELFVECCSRLKATTEKELRGAKKIKLDHPEAYRREIPVQFFGPTKDRWRDAESQNSLGSLLESVNQLLGEEMYGNNDKDNRGFNNQSERSSRSASPDESRPDNLGYEDSLDVAFEHNNKLRDKIQQRMRESENLISNAFGQKSSNSGEFQANQFMDRDNRDENEHIYGRLQNQFNSPNLHTSNGIFDTGLNKGQSLHGGLLDKALSNLLHNNDKHDHNGSTPMTVLAELACARAPTSTHSMKISPEKKESTVNASFKESTIKKSKNPIKELFERKKELYERKQIEKARTVVISKANIQKARKSKKSKKRQEFPLIRNDQYDGLVEKKKRRDIFEKKDDLNSSKTKDVYDFDDEESPIESGFSSVLSYRNKTESSFKDLNSLISKSSYNGNSENSFSKCLESVIDHKFKSVEKYAPKTKGALKAFQIEDKLVTGPMDDFVERKKSSKRPTEQIKHSKLKKKSKNAKRKSRNAWYENDSSDEFITAAKTEDVGVGISKSQRTCSKGKQNLFVELSTSSESESIYEDIDKETIETHEDLEEKTYEDIALNEENIEEKKSFENVDNETYNWEGNTKDTESVISESDSELIIDLKKDSEENKDDISEEEEEEEEKEKEEEKEEEEDNVDDDEDEDEYEDEDEKQDKELRQTKNHQQSKKEWIPLEEALNLLEKNDNLDGITKEMKIFAKASRAIAKRSDSESSNKESKENHSPLEEPEAQDDDLPVLPEKLTTNEKPHKEPENLPLHVFLSRKVQESKKRKQLQRRNKKLQQASMTNFEPIRRQRKCAIGKQGLLAEISSSDDEDYSKISRKRSKERCETEKSRKQKKESKEKRKERYIEKKHEQMIAKEQKAIEEEILRELGKNKEEQESKGSDSEEHENGNKMKKKQKNSHNDRNDDLHNLESKEKKLSKSNQKSKKSSAKKNKIDKPKSRRNSISSSKDSKERRLSSSRRDSGDEELRTTKSWNKVDDDVGVAIGRRKRAAANQLYYWSSSSDEEEMIEATPAAEEEDDRLEQHGWIVGDSHKKMITMLAMEKQLKEKRRRSENEFESGKGKSKKHRNSTS